MAMFAKQTNDMTATSRKRRVVPLLSAPTIETVFLLVTLLLRATDSFPLSTTTTITKPSYTTSLQVLPKWNNNEKNNADDSPPYGDIYSNVFDLYPEDADETTTTSPTKSSTTSVTSNDDDARFSNEEADHLNWVDESLKYFPMVLPVLAYLAYDPTAELFAATLDALAQNNWVAVDGGAYQAKIIAPAINGVVVPAISILFANLIGTTIQTLRQRQLDIRTCLNMEAGQLRILQSLWDVFPPKAAQTCRRYLTQYTTRLIAESQPAMNVEQLDYSLDTELNGVLAELNRLSSTSDGTTVSPLLLGNAYSSCSKLYEERAKRITALRSLFPPLHFVIVSTLAVSICIAFLLESKQDILVFLNAIQLRILWTMLVGTFTALAIVCYDLGNPFRGSYEISKTVHQLYTIRMTLRASLLNQKKKEEDESIDSSIVSSAAKDFNGVNKEEEEEHLNGGSSSSSSSRSNQPFFPESVNGVTKTMP